MVQLRVTPPAHLQETRAKVTGILACASGWCGLQHECGTCYPRSQEIEPCQYSRWGVRGVDARSSGRGLGIGPAAPRKRNADYAPTASASETQGVAPDNQGDAGGLVVLRLSGRKGDRAARNGLKFGPGRAWDGCGPLELEFSPVGPRDYRSRQVALSSFPLSISALLCSVPASHRMEVHNSEQMRLFQGQASHFVPFCPIHICLFGACEDTLSCFCLSGRKEGTVRREMASSLGRTRIKTGGGGLHPPYARTPLSSGLAPPASVERDLH